MNPNNWIVIGLLALVWLAYKWVIITGAYLPDDEESENNFENTLKEK